LIAAWCHGFRDWVFPLSRGERVARDRRFHQPERAGSGVTCTATHPPTCSQPSDPQPKLTIISPYDFGSKAELARPGAARTSEVVDKCWKGLIWFDTSLRGAESGCCRVELSTSILRFELEMAE